MPFAHIVRIDCFAYVCCTALCQSKGALHCLQKFRKIHLRTCQNSLTQQQEPRSLAAFSLTVCSLLFALPYCLMESNSEHYIVVAFYLQFWFFCSNTCQTRDDTRRCTTLHDNYRKLPSRSNHNSLVCRLLF